MTIFSFFFEDWFEMKCVAKIKKKEKEKEKKKYWGWT